MRSEAKAASESVAYLLVGLGNPGEEYAHTRHNAGFDALDRVAEELAVRYWKSECGALSAKAAYHGSDLVLAKPQGFMNTSGGPVKLLCAKYGVAPERLIVIHDDLDIPEGGLNVKFGGGHAGHNGLRSIFDKLMTRDFFRVRVGIGHPPGRMDPADYVLQTPKKEALEGFQASCGLAAQAALSLVDTGLEKTQQQFN